MVLLLAVRRSDRRSAPPRPSSYVIDAMPDAIITDGMRVEVFQIWVDPSRRDAHRDPALRRYLAAMAERHRAPAIICWGWSDSMLLVPPPMFSDGEWLELLPTMLDRAEMKEKLATAPHA
jgi:hypothetical protein